MLRDSGTTLRARPRRSRTAILLVCASFLSGCSELRQPKVEPFFSVTAPPARQELRWSNGKAPRSLDPAKAASAPETDVTRALYEGLTNLDSQSLREVPGVAERWESSEDLRTWTFHLRKDAEWTDGTRVTAQDFVNSWKRLVTLGDQAANSYLFQNIVGMGKKKPGDEPERPTDFLTNPSPEQVLPGTVDRNVFGRMQTASPPASPDPAVSPMPQGDQKTALPPPAQFGVQAVDENTLRVNLDLPDKDFPKLVAHPIFSPVHSDGEKLGETKIDPSVVTNGAFRVSALDDGGITMERSESYWNRKGVALESVRFVVAPSTEAILSSYKKGEVDVVTNATFEPLALKLLAPYDDFRRSRHSALNFYEVNLSKAPFSDRRVREALALSIDRAKLTEGELEGSTQPALSLLPLGERGRETLAMDTVKAKDLMEKAGFPNGEGFPKIRLVINRNDTQQRVGRSVAQMWKQNLAIETEIIVKEAAEMDAVRQSGEFDLIRRGVVLPTNDELVSIESILGSARKPAGAPTPLAGPGDTDSSPSGPSQSDEIPEDTSASPSPNNPMSINVLTEDDVVYSLEVIPLYFPTSYSLVKPFVRGFETNGLDAPSLKEVSIDNDWLPKNAGAR